MVIAQAQKSPHVCSSVDQDSQWLSVVSTCGDAEFIVALHKTWLWVYHEWQKLGLLSIIRR